MTETQPAFQQAKARGSMLTRLLRKLDGSEAMLGLVSTLLGWYVRLVRATTRVEYVPEHPFVTHRDRLPLINTTWHGNLMMISVLRPMAGVPMRVLISHHRDGEIAARVAKKSGYVAVRGSGGEDKDWQRKGAVGGFLRLRASLEEGASVLLTAESQRRTPRTVGSGGVTLARASGAPIMGVGVAASRSMVLNSWDRWVVPLPFGRIVVVPTPLFALPPQASDAELQDRRRELEDALNAATKRAREIAGGRAG